MLQEMRHEYYSKAKQLFFMHSVFFIVVAYGIINSRSDPAVEFTLTMTVCSEDG